MIENQRFVIRARVIGAVHRDSPKLKMFMISVLWSDDSEVIVYRSFQDFKTFHKQLKKKFSYLLESDKGIPKFRGQVKRSGLQQKTSQQSVQRMLFLDTYCAELLKSNQTVTQSSEVVELFLPKSHDLELDFTKNCVTILLSDDLPDGTGGGGGMGSCKLGDSITHPFVTQTYRCVAAYDTKDTKNRPFKVAVDEKLDVLIKDPAGWWLVENEEKRLAWFPAPYLELWEGGDDDDKEFPPEVPQKMSQEQQKKSLRVACPVVKLGISQCFTGTANRIAATICYSASVYVLEIKFHLLHLLLCKPVDKAVQKLKEVSGAGYILSSLSELTRTEETRKMIENQRFVIRARLIGAVHRDSPKLKMFMISVLWSDESEVIVYRSFQDFKKFHRQLKKKFSHLKSDRVIPKFSGQVKRSGLQQKTSQQSVQRMRFLDTYCAELLKSNQTVTQSSEVTQFFLPKNHDLEPDFTKNCVMILLSDDLPDGTGGGGGTGGGSYQKGDNITHPFVTQTYRCVAAYDTKDTKNRPFKVAVDEKLDVLIKDPAGWWLVENEEKRLAWFPAPYLESWEGGDDDDKEFPHGGSLYRAVKSFTSKKEDEVSVPIGSVVEVLRKPDNGWWIIRFNGKGGYIPSMYLQPYNNPHISLFSLQKKLHGSTLNLTDANVSRVGTPRNLHKAQSVDALNENWSQIQRERDASEPEVRTRSRSNMDRLYDNSAPEEVQPSVSGLSSPDLSLPQRRNSSASFESSASDMSKSSDTPPRVPPRPKTDEILNRCTTVTRKAALAYKTHLQIRPEAMHSR
ncbi:uncharacterized protein V6R79_008662 [Siganus canaliculatus]